MMDGATTNKLVCKILGMRMKSPYITGLLLVVLILLIVGSYYIPQENIEVKGENTSNLPSNINGPFKVVDVVDGDTIKVSNGQEKFTIRYIGVDTPETVKPNTPVQCFGKEASNFNKELILNKDVYLETDIGSKDSFGRELRYVYLRNNENLEMVNEILAKEGYAKALTVPPNVKYSKRFVELEKEARENSRGLWERCNSQ